MEHKLMKLSRGSMIGPWMAIGVGFGVLLDNLALGISLGASVGTALGVGLQSVVSGRVRLSTKRGWVIVIILGLIGLLLSLGFLFYYIFFL
jgi:hypothetical protein